MNRLLNFIPQRTSAANFIKIFLAVYDIVPKRGKKKETIFSFESFERDAFKQRRSRPLVPFVPYWKYRSISTTTSWRVRITSTVIFMFRTNGNLICDSVINSSIYQFPAVGDAETQREKEKLNHSPEKYGTEGIRHRDNHPFYAGLRAINYDRTHLYFLSSLSFESHAKTPSHYFSSFKREFLRQPISTALCCRICILIIASNGRVINCSDCMQTSKHFIIFYLKWKIKK